MALLISFIKILKVEEFVDILILLISYTIASTFISIRAVPLKFN
jgi:hypothetical protein